MFGLSIPQLLIILVIVLLLFGTKKLRNLGGDLGSGIKNFKKAMNEGENEAETKKQSLDDQSGRTIDGETTKTEEKNKS